MIVTEFTEDNMSLDEGKKRRKSFKIEPDIICQ